MRVLVPLTLGGIVLRESAMKAFSLTDTLSSFGGGELGKGNGVDIHGVWVRGGLRDR